MVDDVFAWSLFVVLTIAAHVPGTATIITVTKRICREDPGCCGGRLRPGNLVHLPPAREVVFGNPIAQVLAGRPESLEAQRNRQPGFSAQVIVRFRFHQKCRHRTCSPFQVIGKLDSTSCEPNPGSSKGHVAIAAPGM